MHNYYYIRLTDAGRHLPRRWVYFGVAAFLSLLLLHQLGTRSFDDSRQPKAPSYTSPPPINGGTFGWRNRPIHYPLSALTSVPQGNPKKLPRIQHSFGRESAAVKQHRLERRDKVKQTFTRCWQSYRTRAWGSDELAPLSGGYRNTFGGWGATLVDALDTLWIMDLKDEFYEAVNATTLIDFSTSTDDTLNVFETTIRYLGGFLSAFDLSGDERLLQKAIEVGEMLLVPFDTPNHFPITRWEWKKAASAERQEAPSGMLVSELGSLTLEFTRLSQLTGDMRWYDAIARIMRRFDEQQGKTQIPGLWPVVVNPRDEDFTGDNGFTLGGMSDSLYEYLPKQFALLGGLSTEYRKMYFDAMQATIKYMLFKPLTPDNADIIMSGDARGHTDPPDVVLEPKMQHLTCFAGGMLALGGRLFSDEEHVTLGRKITDSCVWAYKHSPHGVMPEIAFFVPCSKDESCTWDEERWSAGILERQGDKATTSNVAQIAADNNLAKGFTEYGDHRYILRPEAIESVFVMYRVTGEEAYRDDAWAMFTAIETVSATQYGNAAISDITRSDRDGMPPKDDRMESFFLGETLKYFYLIYSEPCLISLDEFVLNTEAHPLKRPS